MAKNSTEAPAKDDLARLNAAISTVKLGVDCDYEKSCAGCRSSW